jgi:hypothetical protein
MPHAVGDSAPPQNARMRSTSHFLTRTTQPESHEGFDVMNAPDQVLFDKIKQLPPQRLAEVEDFVDFLREREAEQRLTHAASKASEASEASFAQVWDNDEDAAYDRM